MAGATRAAPASLVWEVLTDYDHLARFIPGLSQSAVQMRAANLVPCPQCKSPKPPHQACPHCGMFRGRQVIPIKAKRTPA